MINTFGELQHGSATRQTDLLSGPLWLLVEKNGYERYGVSIGEGRKK